MICSAGARRTGLRVLRRAGARDPLVVDPAADPGWAETARAAADAGRGLLLRGVHTLAPGSRTVVAALAASAPLVLTYDPERAGAVLGLVRGFATVVTLPRLAQGREHLPALVREVLGELDAPARTTRFDAASWEALLGWSWPGDLAELRTTVVALARRAAGGVVTPDDLPPEIRARHRAGRSPGLLECAERDTVAEALRAADGNRSRAARALGIGRTTLYRKIREFGLG